MSDNRYRKTWYDGNETRKELKEIIEFLNARIEIYDIAACDIDYHFHEYGVCVGIKMNKDGTLPDMEYDYNSCKHCLESAYEELEEEE